MSGMSTGHQHDPGRYEIRVQGRLESRWAAWFDGMTLTPEDDGTTTIHGPVVDQAALHGLLRKLRDLGLPLVSVTQVPSVHVAPPATSSGEGAMKAMVQGRFGSLTGAGCADTGRSSGCSALEAGWPSPRP